MTKVLDDNLQQGEVAAANGKTLPETAITEKPATDKAEAGKTMADRRMSDRVSDRPSRKSSSIKNLQVGALCLRDDGRVLLITSRDTGRWIIPKGWTMRGRSRAAAAMREAWEEAGVKGKIEKRPIGRYRYDKILDDGTALPVEVRVFRVAVDRLLDSFPEAGQRRRRWFRPVRAAKRVAEPELQQLLLSLPKPGKPKR